MGRFIRCVGKGRIGKNGHERMKKKIISRRSKCNKEKRRFANLPE